MFFLVFDNPDVLLQTQSGCSLDGCGGELGPATVWDYGETTYKNE
jgi:hypothetical protein